MPGGLGVQRFAEGGVVGVGLDIEQGVEQLVPVVGPGPVELDPHVAEIAFDLVEGGLDRMAVVVPAEGDVVLAIRAVFQTSSKFKPH